MALLLAFTVMLNMEGGWLIYLNPTVTTRTADTARAATPPHKEEVPAPQGDTVIGYCDDASFVVVTEQCAAALHGL